MPHTDACKKTTVKEKEMEKKDLFVEENDPRLCTWQASLQEVAWRQRDNAACSSLQLKSSFLSGLQTAPLEIELEVVYFIYCHLIMFGIFWTIWTTMVQSTLTFRKDGFLGAIKHHAMTQYEKGDRQYYFTFQQILNIFAPTSIVEAFQSTTPSHFLADAELQVKFVLSDKALHAYIT